MGCSCADPYKLLDALKNKKKNHLHVEFGCGFQLVLKEWGQTLNTAHTHTHTENLRES